MDEFGKSALLAIVALMTSAVIVAAGLVLAPPEGVRAPLPPGPRAPVVALRLPPPAAVPALRQPLARLARLSPPEIPATRPRAPDLPSLPERLTPPPRPVVKPFAPGPYESALGLTLPGPPAEPGAPPAAPAAGAPRVLALTRPEAEPAVPSLQGAVAPPRPIGKPARARADYAPGPYAPALALSLPDVLTAPELPGTPPGATGGARRLPAPNRAAPPTLHAIGPPPRPGAKPLVPLGPRVAYAPAPALSLPSPPVAADPTLAAPTSATARMPTSGIAIAHATLPSLIGAARPPRPGGKPAPPVSSYAPGPYAPALALTIPTPPADLSRLAAPLGPEAAIVLALVPPAIEAEAPSLDSAAPPPTPTSKPALGRQVAAIAPVALGGGAAPSMPALPLPPVDGRPLEAVDGKLPPWRRYAALTPPDDGRPMVAIIIDDLGLNRRRLARTIALTPPLTLAILPYAEKIDGWALQAREAGHELMLHLPMEPLDLKDEDPGPNALLATLGPAELQRRIEWNLSRLDGYVGVNNHMGSRFTASETLMRPLLRRLHDRGLLFVDSLTTSASVGGPLARRMGVPTASRDIFLDNEIDAELIWAQLGKVERCAERKGYCIAIGHPYRETLEALGRWLPSLGARGFQLVPISAIVARRMTG